MSWKASKGTYRKSNTKTKTCSVWTCFKEINNSIYELRILKDISYQTTGEDGEARCYTVRNIEWDFHYRLHGATTWNKIVGKQGHNLFSAKRFMEEWKPETIRLKLVGA